MIRRTALLAALAAGATVRAVRAQDAPLLRVITPPIDAGAQPFYARDLGLFKKAGLNVEISTATSGAAVAAAIAGGAAEIGQSNLVSIAAAHERGIPFVYIAGANGFHWSQHTNAIVVPTASPIRSAADLVGKTISISGLKNITEIGVDAWLEQRGVAPASVRIVELPFSAMPEAVLAGRIDAADMTVPELEDVIARKVVRVIGYPLEAIAKEFVIGGWFATQAWAKAHPDLVQRYTAVMAETALWANAHHGESAKILEKLTGFPVSATTGRVPYIVKLVPQLMQPVIDAAAKYGALKASFPAAELLATP